MNRTDRLQAIYDEIPTVECQGLCSNACGPILMTPAEAQRIRAQGQEPGWGESLTCSQLDLMNRCTVYEVRPLICRLWGAVEGMPCPHGCKVSPRLLTDDEAGALIARMDRAGA